jgi:hypothetical protein
MSYMNDKLKMFPKAEVIIPRQLLPSWVRWPIRIFAYPFMMVDIFSQKCVAAIFKPKYRLEGACKKRGACCHYIHMGWPKNGRLTFVTKIYIFWQTEILGFYFKDFDFVEDNEVTKVMGCRYLSKEGKCTQYSMRPGLCRTWPKLHYLREPTLLKGCGYKAVLRKQAKKNIKQL